MSEPRLHPTRTRLLGRAHLVVVLSALSELHHGEPGHYWRGDDRQGLFIDDNGSGDRIVLAWDAHGLVGLAYAHESGRAHDDDPIDRWLPGLPHNLRALAEAAAAPLQCATAGLWIDGDGPGRMSDPVEPDTLWADGAEMFVRLMMTAEDALFGDSGQSWFDEYSLSREQTELARRLAEASAEGPTRLSASDTDVVLANPEPHRPLTMDLERAARAAETLAQVGIQWELPVARIEALLHEADARRRERVGAQLRSEHATILDAARSGDVERLRACIEDGVDLEARTVDEQYEFTPAGDTPLIQALKAGHRDCAALLIQAGARHDAANAYGQTPLLWAVRGDDPATTQDLLEAGADPSRSDDDAWTPLHWAAAEGFVEIVVLLLAAGADRTAVHRGGLTAADVAELRDRPELAMRLRRN